MLTCLFDYQEVGGADHPGTPRHPSAGRNQDQLLNEIPPAWMSRKLIGSHGDMIQRLWMVQMIFMLRSITPVVTPPLAQPQHPCQECPQHPAPAQCQEHHRATHDSLISMTNWKKYQVTSNTMKMKELSQDHPILEEGGVSTLLNTWISLTVTPVPEAIYPHSDEHPQVEYQEVPQ